MNELPRVLFSNMALMELVGFNARQVEEGLTRRGDAQRKTKKKQGPLSPQCLADNISKLSREQMERLFNQQALLTEVEDALKRIEQGTYGKCVVCGRPIPEKRLEAIAWAARDVEHEEQLERRNLCGES